ncbi:MAG: hypothetical protein ACI9UN_004844 [Granulosicoccus sp.]|jgi:hypothetical protein
MTEPNCNVNFDTLNLPTLGGEKIRLRSQNTGLKLYFDSRFSNIWSVVVAFLSLVTLKALTGSLNVHVCASEQAFQNTRPYTYNSLD